MEQNELSKLSRKELKEKGHLIIPSKKKNTLLILSLFLIGIGISTLMYYYNQVETQKKEEQKAIAAEKDLEQKLLVTIEEQQKELGNAKIEDRTINDQIQQLIYLPTTAQRKTLKQDLEKLLAEAGNQLNKNESLKLVGYIKKNALFGKITTYSPVVDTYQKEKTEWTVRSSSSGETLYMNTDTADLPSMMDLFHEQSNLTAIQPLVKQQLLNEAKEPTKVIDQILSFPEMTMEQKVLSYTPDKVTLSLPKNQLDITQVKLSFSELLDFTDSEFIDPIISNENTAPALDPDKKYISLTFDDGPNPITTPRLLDILSEKNVKASFFMLGQNVVNNPDLARRVATEGHEIGNHSYSHPNLVALDTESIRTQVLETDRAIALSTGRIPTDFRPPYGSVNKAAAEIIGRPIIQWSVDSEDWKTKNTQKIINRVMKTSYGNSIILMHDIYPESIDAVPQIIDSLRREGYEIVPVDVLLTKKTAPLHLYYGNKSEQIIQ